ncbi:MAG: GntR family transcriptional regulator [Victivallales bacterium]
MLTLKNTMGLFDLEPSVGAGDSLLESTANHIRNLIQSGKLEPGARLPGVRHLAKTWPISYVVIQKALEKCANEGLLIRHPGRGTFVADNTHSRKTTGSVHLVIQQTEEERIRVDYSASEYFVKLAAGLQKELAANGVIAMTIAITGKNQEDVFISRLRENPADLVLLARSKNTGMAKQISELKIPLLLIDPHVYPSGRSSVITHDERRAAEDILNFFMENGKDRIGVIVTGDSKWVTACRLEAITEAIRARKAGSVPEWVKTPSIANSNEAIQKAVSEMFSTKRKPNALIVNGVNCHIVRTAIEKLGLSNAGDIMIASYDMSPDFMAASLSIIIDSYEYGKTIGRLICNKFYKEKETSFPEKIMLPFPVAKPSSGE